MNFGKPRFSTETSVLQGDPVFSAVLEASGTYIHTYIHTYIYIYIYIHMYNNMPISILIPIDSSGYAYLNW